MLKQDLFNKVAVHLLKQNKKSLRENVDSGCAYRGTEGLQCAIGCLIPDSIYFEKMEGKTVNGLVRMFDEVLPNNSLEFLEFKTMFEKNKYLMTELQSIHDFIDSSYWHSALKELARKNNLDMPPC